jgi:hypothetical protein
LSLLVLVMNVTLPPALLAVRGVTRTFGPSSSSPGSGGSWTPRRNTSSEPIRFRGERSSWGIWGAEDKASIFAAVRCFETFEPRVISSPPEPLSAESSVEASPGESSWDKLAEGSNESDVELDSNDDDDDDDDDDSESEEEDSSGTTSTFRCFRRCTGDFDFNVAGAAAPSLGPDLGIDAPPRRTSRFASTTKHGQSGTLEGSRSYPRDPPSPKPRGREKMNSPLKKKEKRLEKELRGSQKQRGVVGTRAVCLSLSLSRSWQWRSQRRGATAS